MRESPDRRQIRTERHRRPEGRRLRSRLPARSQGRGAGAGDSRDRRRRAGRARHGGHRRRCSKAARLSLDRPRGRGLQHDRRRDRVAGAASTCRTVPGKNAIAVAELAFALLLALDRRVPDNVAELRAGTWNKKEYSKARGLFGRTLGLLGYGNIGQEMARRAHALRHADRRLEPPLRHRQGATSTTRRCRCSSRSSPAEVAAQLRRAERAPGAERRNQGARQRRRCSTG